LFKSVVMATKIGKRLQRGEWAEKGLTRRWA